MSTKKFVFCSKQCQIFHPLHEMCYGMVETVLCSDPNQGSSYFIINELSDSGDIYFTFKMKLPYIPFYLYKVYTTIDYIALIFLLHPKYY